MKSKEPKPATPDDLMTPAEAASLLSCDVSTLRRWRQMGRLGVTYLSPGGGRSARYKRSDIERIIQSGQVFANVRRTFGERVVNVREQQEHGSRTFMNNANSVRERSEQPQFEVENGMD